MGTIDNNGIFVYDELDQPAPLHTFMNQGMASVSSAVSDIYNHSLIMPVANTAERDAYEADMRAAGRPPSAANPLYVEITANGLIQRHRGAGWERFVDNRLLTTSLGATTGAWERHNTLAKKNGWAMLNLRQKRIGPYWSGTAELTDTAGRIPTAYRPPFRVWGIANIYLRSDGQVSLSVGTDGTVTAYSLQIGTGNWLSASLTWPVDD